MFCEKCGKNIPENSVFCEFCGKSLSNNAKSKTTSRQDNNNSLIAKIKKAGIPFAVWIVSFGVISMLNDSYSDEFGNFIVSIALTSLIIFLWNRISKKYL